MFGIRKDDPRPATRHTGRAGIAKGLAQRLAQGLVCSAALLGLLAALSAPSFAAPQSPGEASNTPAPNLASRACALGNRAHANGDYQQAVAKFTQCMETANLTPEQRARVLTNRGYAYFRLGEQEMAYADFDNAIALKPDLATAYYNRGLAAFVVGRYDDAIADSTEAIRIDPTMAEAFYNRGAAHANQRNFDKAIADLTEAIRLRPNWALAYQSRGDAYLRSGDTKNGALDHAAANRLNAATGAQPAK